MFLFILGFLLHFINDTDDANYHAQHAKEEAYHFIILLEECSN